MRTSSNKIDMTTGAILPKMIRFALPLMASSLLQLVFNAADVAVVGKFCGDTSLAAVSSNGALVNLLVNLFIGISTGSNVLAARYFAARDDKRLSDVVHTSIVISLVTSMLATVIGVFGAEWMLTVMQTPDNVLPLASLYLRIYFAGIVTNIVYNFGSALLRAVGDTKRPMFYLMIAGVLNVVLNLIFVLVFKLDVAGVALATVISQAASAILVIRCLMRETGGIRFIPRALRASKETVKQILLIGLPAGVQGTLYSISNVAIQSSVNSLGEVIMSANGAASNIESFGIMTMKAFDQAVISFTSQNFGKKDYKRIIRVLLIGQACSTTVGIAYSLISLLFGEALLTLYTSSAAVIAAGMLRFVIVSPFMCCDGIMNNFTAALRGIGYSIMPTITSFLVSCVFRTLWATVVFSLPAFHSINTIYAAYPITWVSAALINGVAFVVFLRREMKKDGLLG